MLRAETAQSFTIRVASGGTHRKNRSKSRCGRYWPERACVRIGETRQNLSVVRGDPVAAQRFEQAAWLELGDIVLDPPLAGEQLANAFRDACRRLRIATDADVMAVEQAV